MLKNTSAEKMNQINLQYGDYTKLAEITQEKGLGKNGSGYTARYIRRVVDPEDSAKNDTIMAMVNAYAEANDVRDQLLDDKLADIETL